MISIKHIEMKEILKKFKEEETGKVAFQVTDGSAPSQVNFDNFHGDEGSEFTTAHFCELNGNPLTVYRRWDVMKYYPSYDDIAWQMKHGRAKIVERLTRSVIMHHPVHEVVVILAVPSERKTPSQKEVNNWLCGRDPENKEIVEELNKFNNDDILEYIAVNPNRTNAENQNRLFSRIMNIGAYYNSENEWFPREFVLITQSINWFTDHEPSVMQSLLAKGIRVVEIHDDIDVSDGKIAIDRIHEFGLLYFPTDDFYLTGSGVEYHNYYVRSRISNTRLDFNAPFTDIHIPVVMKNESEYPFMAAQQIVYAIHDQCFAQKNYERVYDFNFVFASCKDTKYAIGYAPRFDLDMCYGNPTQVEKAVTSENVEEYLANGTEVITSYNYFLYFIPKDMTNIPKEEILNLGKKLAKHKYYFIIMYEFEPKQGSELETIMKMMK